MHCSFFFHPPFLCPYQQARGAFLRSTLAARTVPRCTVTHPLARVFRSRCGSHLYCNAFAEGLQQNSSPPIQAGHLVAQCSATPATVAATPSCSATPFQTQISVRHLPAQGGGRCDTKIFRGCSATPLLHLQNAIKSRKSAATRVARQGVPAIVCN